PEVIFPEGKGRRFWNWKSKLAHRQADFIMTVSEHARRSIIRVFGHKPERVIVVDEAPEPIFRKLEEREIDRQITARYRAPEAPFLIYVGGINPHKNLPALIDALAAIRDERHESVDLLIVGELDTERFTPGLRQVREKIAALSMQNDVIFAGRVDDNDLVHLLNAASALVLPSLAEGFGLPAIEAAACGTPVIATRNSPLPDLLGDGGIWVDPLSAIELREGLRKILDDSAARDLMGAIAHERAARLSWEASARQLQDLFREAGRR
ncbi:MAG TPA: glycosyltransferase family 1 protein, partial [Thermoanaerobaculia bacterium]|nr:glycosyltransferase family 1 protein [Thermoanaerobaculia bacterium]